MDAIAKQLHQSMQVPTSLAPSSVGNLIDEVASTSSTADHPAATSSSVGQMVANLEAMGSEVRNSNSGTPDADDTLDAPGNSGTPDADDTLDVSWQLWHTGCR